MRVHHIPVGTSHVSTAPCSCGVVVNKLRRSGTFPSSRKVPLDNTELGRPRCAKPGLWTSSAGSQLETQPPPSESAWDGRPGRGHTPLELGVFQGKDRVALGSVTAGLSPIAPSSLLVPVYTRSVFLTKSPPARGRVEKTKH